ncbi:hypothetical protein [Jannaschia pohangensis]|uniref:Uncharacterized protein n=1 Tax=Jannaschia pohangensis TaxID=390807 RepID=A0A1I3P342_9RHOB|nr:hypothetical protein [Jannaschia pohangensis]SFJ15975.1 hypothetical protein SAMN04488095_2332 [Jannaschia pohangensis]
MRLTAETLDQLKAGRFEDFLDDGAAQLRQRFPTRFYGFEDDAALDAGRNVVGFSFETVCALGRRSGLLAMRIAFLRTAFGFGVLDDVRWSRARQLVDAQVTAATIKPNTSIGTYLTETRRVWDRPAFARGAQARRLLLDMDRGPTWDAVLLHLERSHEEVGSYVSEPTLREFINQSYVDATMLGLKDEMALYLHVLAADALGRHFFDDPLLPDWGTLYRTGNERQIVTALQDALSPKEP